MTTEPADLIKEDTPGNEPVEMGRLSGFIGFRLRRIQGHLSRSFSEETQEFGLRSGALSALAIIEANPGISQALVAREIGMDASAAVALLEELGKNGWTKRVRVANDRRRYAIHLTDKGKTMLDRVFEILGKTEDAALRSLSSNELLMLNRALDVIYQNCFRI
jgi:DNA-binding MarR family transcriptional regulator